MKAKTQEEVFEMFLEHYELPPPGDDRELEEWLKDSWTYAWFNFRIRVQELKDTFVDELPACIKRLFRE